MLQWDIWRVNTMYACCWYCECDSVQHIKIEDATGTFFMTSSQTWAQLWLGFGLAISCCEGTKKLCLIYRNQLLFANVMLVYWMHETYGCHYPRIFFPMEGKRGTS